jgi:hypothetical protein
VSRRRTGHGQSKSGSMKVSFLVPDWSKFVFFDVFVDENPTIQFLQNGKPGVFYFLGFCLWSDNILYLQYVVGL